MLKRCLFVSAVLACLGGLAVLNLPPVTGNDKANPPALENEQEKELATRINSIGLFKNGLALVKREITIDGPGKYRLADSPEPVHGTFFIESATPIHSFVYEREVAVKAASPSGRNLAEELAGSKVTLFNKQGTQVASGTVLVTSNKEEETEEVTPPEYGYSYRPPVPSSRFLVLKTDTGLSYVDQNEIGRIETNNPAATVKRMKPVLVLHAGPETKPGRVQISYLTHGLSWAPSYHVDLKTEKDFTIEQNAVIRNELIGLNQTEVSLISGFPSVQFAHVKSPLVARQTWRMFFDQLRSGGRGDHNALAQQMSNSVRSYAASAPILPAQPGETIDLHFNSIGKVDLKKGESMAFASGQQKGTFERIIDWTIPDNRNEHGGVQNNGRQIDPETGEPYADDVWDALKFKNPFTHPMTTGPVLVSQQGKFNGQRQTNWVNPGEETTLRVNKALSIRTKCTEYEVQIGNGGVSERETVYIGGARYRKAKVKGELQVCCHRDKPADIQIRRRFSGDIITAERNPKINLREEGIFSVNKRNELFWTLKLEPSKEINIKYEYSVLISY